MIEKTNNFMKYASNPKAFTLKKWLTDILKDEYLKHDQIVERISHALITDKDLKDFGDFVSILYQTGYMKAVNEYKSKLEEMGIKTIVGQTNLKNSD